jgi:cephalosporin-C deacetylase-like acetyl esterase
MRLTAMVHACLRLAFFGFISAAIVRPQILSGQPRPERTLDEIRAEAMRRAENQMYPLIGLDPEDVRQAFTSIKTRDPDEWAAAFSSVANRYLSEASTLESTDPAKANADYIRAWRLYSFARWPVPSSPGKKRAYAQALDAFLRHARFLNPPLEVVRIPFEGKEIVGYLRLPEKHTEPVPLVVAVNGLDSRKEDLSESFAAILPYGIGFLAVDGPGTGQAPLKAGENSERMLARVLDYLATRPEVDKNRLAVHGVSWGAYWATKLAIIERSRLRAASAQSPPVDAFFQKDFLVNSLLGNREYLFDQVPALMSIFDGLNSVDELERVFPKMSLVSQGLLGKPTAPMLILGGVLDTQVPISDLYLLLSKGDVPKEAWINPAGGHLGRQVKLWPDPVIFRQVIIPWLVRTLEATQSELPPRTAATN